MGTGHRAHRVEDPCTAGRELYERALREGHTAAADAAGTPCLVGSGPLHPARPHIAKPAAGLGSGSRAQPGHLIARAGVPDPDR
ncbi:hypothetical protein [Streptomyces sp. SP2-10]|uniref:hypothetical protein n=1 Tax=Streptomyces sp. SP2-10 TaxID=2873385 RepID=UPI001CA78CE7|nr:hypothetical protein [Streptomyces sp. SP2-10]MBY8844908.1 hypothetical protein [Streptomyces sp. SP2-10]